ncbi:hypothetical protein [Streptomonospora nanhaiensis]|uniref:hypothetical protein n=1 Tax=Streptomonospora nanhaiensis TaxID=1323731 RepID=UPI001C3920BA|nr:hypothetical protein [Streptomonospora nanhaiensis]MBV2364231.1 hypothetical protein [Streptomonospora nanhaiensis]
MTDKNTDNDTAEPATVINHGGIVNHGGEMVITGPLAIGDGATVIDNRDGH